MEGLWQVKEKELRVMIRFMAWAIEGMNGWFTEIGSTRGGLGFGER